MDLSASYVMSDPSVIELSNESAKPLQKFVPVPRLLLDIFRCRYTPLWHGQNYVPSPGGRKQPSLDAVAVVPSAPATFASAIAEPRHHLAGREVDEHQIVVVASV
jgi:hypothetical protein